MRLTEQRFLDIEGISKSDIAIAEYLSSKTSGGLEAFKIFLVLALHCSKQHGGCPIDELKGQSLEDILKGKDLGTLHPWTKEEMMIPHDIEAKLASYERAVGFDDPNRPVVYDTASKILYLQRYYRYEREISNFIIGHQEKEGLEKGQQEKEGLKKVGLEKVGLKNESLEKRHLEKSDIQRIQNLFPNNEVAGSPNWQKVAAISAMVHRFSVIAGGPGTGKTTTVAKVLALLLTQNPDHRIDILAPTGKAADRLSESINKALGESQNQFPGISQDTIDKLPRTAVTIHRFLKYRPGKGFTQNRHQRCNSDIVLIDESSMVSLKLFSSIFAALKPNARVICLGDPHQLCAVDTGQVLGEITATNPNNQFGPKFLELLNSEFGMDITSSSQDDWNSRIVHLQHSYRFDAHSGVGTLAKAINQADGGILNLEPIFTAFQDQIREICGLHSKTFKEQLIDLVSEHLQDYQNIVKSKDPQAILQASKTFQILCSHNKRVFGVHNINQIISKDLFKHSDTEPFDGKIIMLTQNDHQLQIYNGDCGIILGKRVYFPGNSGIRSFAYSSLCHTQTAFAMSIHKSQGSEFNEVLMILDVVDSPHLSKELIYTGITRAKSKLTLWHEPSVTALSASRKTQRTSSIKNILQAH